MSALDRLLAQATRPWRRQRLAATACAVAAACAALALAALSGWFITGAALAGAGGVLVAQAFNYLLPSAAIRLLAIIRTTARYGERLLAHKAALFALATVRTRIFAAMADAATADSEAATRLVQDVSALEDRLVRRPSEAGAAAGGAAALLLTGMAGLGATIALACLMLLMIAIGHVAARRLLPAAAERVQARTGRLKSAMIDQARAAPEILAYGLEALVERALAQAGAALDEARQAFARREAAITLLPTLAGGAAVVAVLLLSTAALPVTVLAALAALAGIEAVGVVLRMMARDSLVAVAKARLDGIIAVEPPTGAPLVPAADIAIGGPTPVRLARGERLALTGRSGSGKTSLIECLAGLRADSPLPLRLDDVPIETLDPGSYRPRFALAPQGAALIAGTIADNLRLGAPGLEEPALWSALETACLADEVRAMPDRLLTWVGDNGVRLSGGQRKRLAIARALLAGRPWLLLDEPSEGLDAATEARLCANLAHWLDETGAGLVMATHRAAPLALASRRLSLDRRD